MTLVVSIGGALLGGSILGAGAAGTGVLAGTVLGSTAGALGVGGALAAGAAGTAALAGAGLAANEMFKGAPADTSKPNVPGLAPGLGAAMSPQEAIQAGTSVAPQNAAPLQGLSAIGTGSAAPAPALAPQISPNPEQKAAQGGVMYAHGGHVPLKNGAYIIPADVVSALGNGSSKAGAEFLQRLMVQVKHEATKRQGLGAARKHVA